MSSLPSFNAKAMQFGDLTDGGKDATGTATAVALGTAAGALVGVLVADRLTSPTPEARLFVAACAGAVSAAYVSGGASKRNTNVTASGFFMGGIIAVLGARLLKSPKLSKAEKREQESASRPGLVLR